MLCKEVLYAIFFSGEGITIQVPVKKGKRVTGNYYKDVVLKKLKKYFRNGFQLRVSNMLDIYMIMPQPICLSLLQYFMQKEKVTVLPHPPYSPDLAPCDFFLFPKLKTILAGVILVQTGAWICHIPVPYQYT